MKRYLPLLFAALLLLPVLRAVMQDEPITLEITGVNTSEMPVVTITTSVVDETGQSVPGLGIQSFTLSGSITERAEIVSVQNITADNLPFAAVLVMDVSSSIAGEPFAKIQEAARLFVNSVGADDPIAIVTFSNDPQLILDYTTDKNVLLTTIDNLTFGGRTALYDAAVFAVDVAARAPVPRRAVVLLSDGAEFGGVSENGRDAGLTAAVAQSVPFYTIGLGFGTDRTYLANISRGTNARFYEAPTPDELNDVYTGLAVLFRSQYVITLNFDSYDPVQDGGAEFDVTLQAAAPQGDSTPVTTTLRVPVPIPLVSLPEGILTAPISETTTLMPQIEADDAITSIEYVFNDTTSTGESLTIDPAAFPPGTYPLTITVTDETGDVTTLETQVEIAALPPVVTLNWSPGDAPITEPQVVSIEVTGQTPLAFAVFSIITPTGPFSGFEDDSSDTEFTFDPFNLGAAGYILRVDVTNAGGGTTTVEQPFDVGNIPPRNIVVSGISEGQTIDTPVTLSADAAFQQGASPDSTAVTAGNVELSDLTIDPMQFPPGNTPVTVTLTDSQRASASQTVNVVIAALPPVVELTAPGSPVTGPVEVPVSIASQTLLIGATYSIDGGTAVSLQQNNDGTIVPIQIDPSVLGGGEHTLAVRVVNAGQQVTTAEVTFSVLLPTATPTATFTATLDTTGTAVALANVADSTANAVATTNAEATGAAQAALDVQATTSAQSTAVAQGTQNAIATVTANFEATVNADAQATRAAISTQNALLTATVAQGTQNARATITAVALATQESVSATQNAIATANAQLTQNAIATQNAQATAEQQSANAQATATLQALATLDAQATVRAQRTLDAQSTDIALANANAFATATAIAQSTLDVQATRNAEATLELLGTATAEMQATRNAESTSVANLATSDAESAALTATRNAAATLTAQPTITPSPAPEVATLTPTPEEIVLTPIPGSAQSGQGGFDANSLVPLCIVGLVILLIVVVVLFLRGRRTETP